MANLRLFLALPLPLEVRSWIASKVPDLPDARLVPEENLHVTLKFLGSTDPGRVKEVEAACLEVAAGLEATEARPSGLGAFPTVRRASVVWVGLEERAGAIAALERSLSEALEPLGWVPERRTFTPHVTVARLRRASRVELPDIGGGPSFPVDAFELMQSFTGPSGSRYETVARFPLASSP
jgi:2'-5' RNA ligase